MRISKMRYFFPIGTFLFLFLDGSLSHLFALLFLLVVLQLRVDLFCYGWFWAFAMARSITC
jgi:hypothetical protein